MVDLDQVQEFFFKAMLAGWVAGAPEAEMPKMPGYKSVSFRQEQFYLLDTYCINPDSRKSAGTTTIWYNDAPVWVMSYGGYYPKKVLLFVKEALRVAYVREEFFGGRGPLRYKEWETPFLYKNAPSRNIFSDFWGREVVYDQTTGRQIGHHAYQGMSLLF